MGKSLLLYMVVLYSTSVIAAWKPATKLTWTPPANAEQKNVSLHFKSDKWSALEGKVDKANRQRISDPFSANNIDDGNDN